MGFAVAFAFLHLGAVLYRWREGVSFRRVMPPGVMLLVEKKKKTAMDWLSFGIALAGLIATTIVSFLGFYFTHKARTLNYRDLLYQKQLDLIVELMELAQLMELDADLVAGADSEENRELYRKIFVIT